MVCVYCVCYFFRKTLIGVNSWSIKKTTQQGLQCIAGYSPSVFARVNKVLKWIKDKTDDTCTSAGKKLDDYDFASETGRDEERNQLLNEIKFGLDEIVELQNEKSYDHTEGETRADSTEESDIIQERDP